MDATAFSTAVVDIVRGFLERELDPILDRMKAIETALASLPKPKDGEDGKSITVEDVAPMIKEEIDRVAGSVVRLIPEAVEAAVKVLPPAKDGKDADPETMKAWLVAEGEQILAALPAPENGKDCDMEAVRLQVAETIENALAGLEKPKDGTSVTVEDVKPLIEETVAKSFAAMPVPKDGKNGLDAVRFFRGDKGNLLVSMSNGDVHDLGQIDGADADMAALERSIAEKFEALPTPKDGIDGIGFDDMRCEIRDDGVHLVWEKGDVAKEARLPIPIDRGVWKDTGAYLMGDGVTWGGSFFIAQKDDPGKPETAGCGWRMAVKRGRDGKDKG